MASLYLVRGNDTGGENQDYFVVADNGEEAVELWNEYCVDEEIPRDEDDEHDPDVSYTPQNIRNILADVTGTEHAGVSRVIPWEDLETE